MCMSNRSFLVDFYIYIFAIFSKNILLKWSFYGNGCILRQGCHFIFFIIPLLFFFGGGAKSREGVIFNENTKEYFLFFQNLEGEGY